MAIFKDTTITDNGRALIADTLANNKQIIFTRMITSSKIYEDSTDVSKLTNIDEIKQTVSMSKISQEGTRVRLNAVFTNSTVNTSYKIQTIGLYAKTGTGNEILYSITRAKEPDVMPATNGINLATVEIDLITEINNSNGATMLMNPSTLVTTSNLVAELEKIAGLEFGGNIQDIGNKTKGKFYYDNVTKFYYECIEDNSLTYNDSGKFRAISNKPLSDKVENLPRFYTKTANVDFSNDKFTIKIPKSNFLFGILEVSQKLYGWSNKIIFTKGESCFEHVSSMLSQRLVITTDSQNVYLVSQDKNISLFLINSVTFFYYD
jgi:hypothetical protein